MDIYNLVSFFGIFVIIFFAWLISENRSILNWKVIVWGIIFQMAIALFIFIVPAGAKLFLFLNGIVIQILDAATAGARFLFGRLALAPGQVNEAGETSLGFMLAFQAFPTIIFFSSLISILYFLNIMPFIVRGFAYLFTRLMKISGAESLVTVSNIFVGIEAMLTVRPHLHAMTRSEVCTVLAAGMATVSSNVLALYVFSLKENFPTIAGHLISASLLSAPAVLMMAKVILPETETPETLGVHIRPEYDRENNLFQAVINGANSGVKMIIGISALLIAVLGLVALTDSFLSFLGARVNAFFGSQCDWSLSGILGYIYYPFTIVLGIPPSDAGIVSKIIAERMVVTEVVAYQDLAVVIRDNVLVHPRSAVVTTYALCGFAHLASMAIFVGGFIALVPQKARMVSEVAPRALIAATLACLLTASVAGTFFVKDSILLGGIG